MSTITILLLTLTWIVGVCVRVYRQARFFQIEEYMNLRYLRWWVHKRERVIVNRAVVAAFVGGVLAFFLSEAPDSILPAIIGLIASIIALIPPDEGEIKKPFRRTQRATRLLGTAFVLVAILMFITVLGIINADIDIELAVIALMVSGLVLFTAAPTLLVLANLLMFPVEGYLRGQFVKRAKGVIADIHPKVIGITGSP